jgi:hypothetical protein
MIDCFVDDDRQVGHWGCQLLDKTKLIDLVALGSQMSLL